MSREQLCAAFLVLTAVDGAVALLGWCWHVQKSKPTSPERWLHPRSLAGTPAPQKSLFQTLFPSPQQPLSAPARQLAGVTVTGFISTKLCSWAEPWAGPASPAQASQDTASLSLLFVSGKWSSYCPKRHQGALIKPGGSRCPIFTSPSSPGMQLKLLSQ